MRVFVGYPNGLGRASFRRNDGYETELQEVHPTDFDHYLRTNNPNLHKELTMAPQNRKKITKKFYVGSPKMNPLGPDGSLYEKWAKGSLDAAIEAAKQKCEETGESQIVVQIVRVIRPQERPIIVEKI